LFVILIIEADFPEARPELVLLSDDVELDKAYIGGGKFIPTGASSGVLGGVQCLSPVLTV